MRPLYASENDIPQELVAAEEQVYREQVADSGKPADIVKQIIEGKLQKYKESVSLLSQAWVKDDTKTIKNLVEETVAKVGENIEVKRFARYEI